MSISIKKKISKLAERLDFLFDRYGYVSYSQEGEDMIVKRFMEHVGRGFYVDVGAYHPKRFSNTYYFYKKGWRGINIDATPGSMQLFNKLRPRDINLEVAVSNTEETLTFHKFNNAPINTFSKELSRKRNHHGPFKIREEVPMKTKPLSKILDRHLSPDQEIDFLTIDVEGMDLQVLQSNNWQRYRPTLVLVEELNFDSIENSEVAEFLDRQGYHFCAKTYNTVFYQKDD